MNKSILSFSIFFFAFGCQTEKSVTIVQYNRTLDSLKLFYHDYAATKAELDYTSKTVDSLKSFIQLQITPKVRIHDSLVNHRAFLRDRAERRGLFWGGLAKGFVK